MKPTRLFLSILFLASITSLAAQKVKETDIYPFQGTYYNLKTLKPIDTNSGIDLSKNFKTTGPYKGRFQTPVWFLGYPDSVSFKGHYFQLTSQMEIQIFNGDQKLVSTIKNPEKSLELDQFSESNFLLSTSYGVVHIKRIGGEHGYFVRLYNESGKQLKEYKFEHTQITLEDDTYHHEPYLYFLTNTDKHIVFSSHHSREVKKTVVLQLDTKKQSEFSIQANGVIRSEGDQDVIGLVEIHEEWDQMRVNLINTSWFAEFAFGNSFETLVKDSILVVASYHNIATGSNLRAFNLYTGNPLWTADVKQLMVGHSKYYNYVWLSMYNDKIVMEGLEAYGSYLQVFDLYTGKRLFSTL